jgi:hypothetical protein
VVEFPGLTVCDEGDAEIEKSVTARLVVAECVRLLLVPVIVSVEVAGGVVPLVVVTVIVEGPLPVMVGGAKLALAPAGNPVAVRVTGPVNPLTATMVTV